MVGLILSIFAKIKDLLDRLTVARANKLDNLNTTLSSRAPASTAVSSNIWTNTKAGHLNTSLSSRASQSTVNSIANKANTLKQRANVKVSSRLTTMLGTRKVQSGATSAHPPSSGSGIDLSYSDHTISAVANINKCLVLVSGGFIWWDGSEAVHYPASARLINTTTVRVFINLTDPSSSAGGGDWLLRARWQVAEFK